MKVVFFTKYDEAGPSSRYRVYQYLERYKAEGIKFEVYPLFEKEYFFLKGGSKVFYVLKKYVKRFFYLHKVFSADLVYIEYELFPYFLSFFEVLLSRLNVKYIVDYDDAIFHNYDINSYRIIRFLLKNKIRNVIKNAYKVITGSPYLTEYAQKFNENVVEIPTSISSLRYQRKTKNVLDEKFIIGWIGSKSTSINVVGLVDAFKRLSDLDYSLRLVGFDTSLEDKLQGLKYEILPWSSETEIQFLSQFDVGIMPLEENFFNKGKCGFKLIQYMACSKPTISSPLEANLKINRNKKNLHANTLDEWEKSFRQVYENRIYFKLVGEENYNDFVKYYSVEANAKHYILIFNSLIV